MKGYIIEIEKTALENSDFRRVLYTSKNSQLVVMSLGSGEEIGEEVHDLDQFIRCEQGVGRAVLNGVEHKIEDGVAVLVPAGVRHNIINSGSGALKLYTLYSPPEHKDQIVHRTKQDSLKEEHFDGLTTE